MREEINTPYNHEGITLEEFAGLDSESMELRFKALEKRIEKANKGFGMKMSEIMEDFENTFTKRELAFMLVQEVTNNDEAEASFDEWLRDTMN